MSDQELSLHIQDGQTYDLSYTHIQLQQLVQKLTSKDLDKPRKQHLADLRDLVSQCYSYNSDLSLYLTQLFPPNELLSFLDANQAPRPLVIRTNTLKTKRRELAQRLIQKGVNLDPLADWSKVGLKIIQSQVPIGATTQYLSGHYIRQAANSFLPVMALAPKPGQRVLDLCAAPGAKTTYIGQLMKNQGVIVANQLVKERTRSVKANLHRMGITNSIVTNYDGRVMNKYFNCFDRVLLDAPCSGLGVIWKDQSIKAQRTMKEIEKNSHIQKELILAAIDCLNLGYLVYSTCSITVEENQEVVQHALKNRSVKIVETGFNIGEEGFPRFRGKVFHPDMKKCKRFYPHVDNMEGFFVAKLRKYSNQIPKGGSRPHSGEKRKKVKKVKKEKEEKIEVVPEESEEQEEIQVEVPKPKKKSKYFEDVEIPLKRKFKSKNKIEKLKKFRKLNS